MNRSEIVAATRILAFDGRLLSTNPVVAAIVAVALPKTPWPSPVRSYGLRYCLGMMRVRHDQTSGRATPPEP